MNINSARGKDFLKKLKGKKQLPQLLKLSVCGINKGNWKDLCDALSAHPHLESLSLGLQEDFTEDMRFDNHYWRRPLCRGLLGLPRARSRALDKGGLCRESAPGALGKARPSAKKPGPR